MDWERETGDGTLVEGGGRAPHLGQREGERRGTSVREVKAVQPGEEDVVAVGSTELFGVPTRQLSWVSFQGVSVGMDRTWVKHDYCHPCPAGT